MTDTKKIAPKETPKPVERDWKKECEELEAKLAKLEADKNTHTEPETRFDRKNMTRMVKGVFRFFENKGGELKWADRFPWKGARVQRFKARDNETIELPFYVAMRLMEKGKQPVFTITKDSDRRPKQVIKEYRRRFEFFPFDEELLKKQRPELATVTNI